jgi:hypothetical protein
MRLLQGIMSELGLVCCKQSAVRGFHVYRFNWQPVLDQICETECELNNINDRFAVAVKVGGISVGHLPREQSRVCHYFIQRGGCIQVEISDTQYRRSLFEQGGLEIPCTLIFISTSADVERICALLPEIPNYIHL